MTLTNWHEESIAKRHNRKGFDCGQADLNGFLAKHARQAHESGASKTYVAVDNAGNPAILGFYTLSPAQIDFNLAPEAARPAGSGRHPIGGFRLGRLAVSKTLQGQGLGGELLIAAARRYYNQTVYQYNSRLQSFPDLVVARLGAFHEREFFALESPAEAQPPTADFSGGAAPQ